MTDPAIEAAQRAWADGPDEVASIPYRPGETGLWTPEAMEAATREALKPIRKLHKPGPISRLSTAWMVGGAAECTTCRRDWPCSTARLIYTSEELCR